MDNYSLQDTPREAFEPCKLCMSKQCCCHKMKMHKIPNLSLINWRLRHQLKNPGPIQIIFEL